MITRYEDRRMAEIWSRDHEIELWADIETAWIERYSVDGAGAARRTPVPSANRVATRENLTRHEFTAFLDLWTNRFDGAGSLEAARWAHYGLTSSDVIDTANAIRLAEANDELLGAARDLLAVWSDWCADLSEIEQVGRTHGQWAQPRPMSGPFEAIAHMLGRQTRRLRTATEDLAESDLSGPTGARIGLNPQSVRAVLNQFGLRRALYTTQIVPRDSLVAWAHTVSGLAAICAAFAEQIWLLAQSGIDEIRLGDVAPSSAMPHKRNPASAENISGLAHLAHGLAGTLDRSIIQRGDRDLAHSAVERVAVPDLCHLVATTIHRTRGLAESVSPVPNRIAENLSDSTDFGSRSHEEVMNNVRQGMSRADAMQKETRHP